MRSLRALLVSVLAALILAPAPVLHTQTLTCTIEGTVTDRSGAVLPGVAVTARAAATGVLRTAVTDVSGRYRLIGLSPGTYEIRAELPGFTTVAMELTLAAGERVTRDLRLEVGHLEETVRVTAAAPTVAVSSAAVASHVTSPSWRLPRSSAREFDTIAESGFVRVEDQPLSTFSVDVDTASYAYTRRALAGASLPPKGAVRIEEFLNYFRYDYPQPRGEHPISVTTEVARCPWNAAHYLAHIGLQARRTEGEDDAARNLVFLIDVSGSMQPPDKLPLVKAAMRLLANGLTARDTVAIVVYAGSSGLVLPPTTGDEKDRILAAIDRLEAGGSTNGGDGIRLAYRLAETQFRPGGVNRVVAATDGDFNVGITSRAELLKLIEKKRDSGVFLSVLGVGDDNLKDGALEQLADRGNGNYAYLDTLEEAQKVLVREASATLVTVAKDVKIQVEFNPAHVAGYRLIGYENRALAAEDFKDDTKDAGEIGAGHSVTALYEIVPAGGEVPGGPIDALRYQVPAPRLSAAARTAELLTVKLRYKLPAGGGSRPVSAVVMVPGDDTGRGTPNLEFSAAVAAFGMLLRESKHSGRATWEMAATLARRSRGADPDGYRAQFIRLVEMAEGLTRGRQKTR